MKQIMVTIALMILGVVIFAGMMGDEGSTLKTAGESLMQKQIEYISD